MGKVARSFNGFPPSVSLNTSGYFGGSPEVSAWNHRSFPNKETDRLALSEEVIAKLWTSNQTVPLLISAAKIQKIFDLSRAFSKNLLKHPPIRLHFLIKCQRICS